MKSFTYWYQYYEIQIGFQTRYFFFQKNDSESLAWKWDEQVFYLEKTLFKQNMHGIVLNLVCTDSNKT